MLASVQTSTRSLANRVHQLTGHCNVSLMHDSVRDLAGAVEPEFGLSETNVVGSTVYGSPAQSVTSGDPYRWLCVVVLKNMLCVLRL